MNGDSLSLPFSAELDNLKAEILREIRTEIQKAKQEILDGKWKLMKSGRWNYITELRLFSLAVIKLELNRR